MEGNQTESLPQARWTWWKRNTEETSQMSSKAAHNTCSNRDVSSTLGSKRGRYQYVCLWGTSRASGELSWEGGKDRQKVRPEGRHQTKGRVPAGAEGGWGRHMLPEPGASGADWEERAGKYETLKRPGVRIWKPLNSWQAVESRGMFLAWRLYDQECMWRQRDWPLVQGAFLMAQPQRLGLCIIHSLSSVFWCHPSLVFSYFPSLQLPIYLPSPVSVWKDLTVHSLLWLMTTRPYRYMLNCDWHSICTSYMSFHSPNDRARTGIRTYFYRWNKAQSG